MANCNKNIDVLSSKLDKNMDLANPKILFQKLTNNKFLEYYHSMNDTLSKKQFNAEKTLGVIMNELFDKEDRLISNYLMIGTEQVNIVDSIKELPFTIEESYSAINYVSNKLLTILDTSVNRKDDNGKFVKVNISDLSYTDIISNKRNDIERLLVDAITKDIKKLKDVIAKKQTNVSKLDSTTIEFMEADENVKTLIGYLEFKERILENIISNNADLNIFNESRNYLDLNKGVTLRTRSELLEYIETLESEKLSKNFDDSKAFSVDVTNHFSKATKQAIAKLKDIDTVVHNSLDKYTGESNTVMVEAVLNKLLYLAAHQTHIDGMIKEWSKYRHIYGWIDEFIDLIKANANFASGVYTDFNKAINIESKLMINAAGKNKNRTVNVAVTTKDFVLAMADDIENFAKSGLYRKSFDNDTLTEDIRTIQSIVSEFQDLLKTNSLISKLNEARENSINTGVNIVESFDKLVHTIVRNKESNNIISKLLTVANKYNVNFTSEILYAYMYKSRNLDSLEIIANKLINHILSIQKNIDVKFSEIQLNHGNVINMTSVIFDNSSGNLDLMYFDAKGDKKYRIGLPTMISDFESIMLSHLQEKTENPKGVTRLEQWYMSVKDFTWIKRSSWFGIHGKFIKYTGDNPTDFIINTENVKLFKIEMLSQMINLNFKEVNEYKEYSELDWFVSNYFAFEGTQRDKVSRNNFNRTFFPTQSDSSVPRVINAPSINTDTVFNYLYLADAIDEQGRNITFPDTLVDLAYWANIASQKNYTMPIKPLTIRSYDITDTKATYNITMHGITITATKIPNQDALLVNPVKTVTPITIDDVTCQELLDIAAQDINIFTQARDLLFDINGDLKAEAELLQLPSEAYFTIIPTSRVKEGDVYLPMSSPLAGIEYLNTDKIATNPNYVKLVKRDGKFVGSAFKFANFSQLSELYDSTTLQLLEKYKDKVVLAKKVKSIVLDFIKTDFDSFYNKYKDDLKDVKPFMSKKITKRDSVLLTPVEIKSAIFKMYLTRLVNNNEIMHLFLGNFSTIALANKRAKSIFSGKQISSPLNLNKHKDRADRINIIVAGDIMTNSLLNVQRERIARRMLSTMISNETLLNKQVNIITKSYNNIARSDGQTVITLPFWIRLMKQSNQWDKYSELFEEYKDNKGKTRYRLVARPNMELVTDLLIPGKPFGKSTNIPLNVNGQIIPYNQQLKTSYIIAISEYIQEPTLRALIEKMEEDDIDMITFTTSCKEQMLYVNDIFNPDGTVKVENLESLVVDTFNAHDFGIILEVPEEHLDKQTKIGIQIAKLIKRYLNHEGIYTDMFTKEQMTGKQLKDLIENIESLNIEDGFNRACESLGINYDLDSDGEINITSINYNVLISYLKENTLAKDRVNLAEMLELDINSDLQIPLIHPTNVVNLLSLVGSKFKNLVTNQKMLGGHFVLFSDIYQNLYNTLPSNQIDADYIREGSNLGATIDENTGALILECKISLYSAQLLFGSHIKQLKDIDESLHYIVGYRIPSTGQESLVVLKVVGILPETVRSSIVVNHEIIPRTGTDFDVDHLYLMFKEGFSTIKGIKPYADLTFDDYKKYNELLAKKDTAIDDFYRLLDSKNVKLDELIEIKAQYNQTVINIIDEITNNNLSVEQLTSAVDNLEIEIDNVKRAVALLNNDRKETKNLNEKSVIRETTDIYLKELKQLKTVKRIIANKLINLTGDELDLYKTKLESVIKKLTKLDVDNQNLISIYDLHNLVSAVADVEVRTPLLEIIKEVKSINDEIKNKQYEQFDRLSDYNITDENSTGLEFQPKVIRDNKLIDSYLSILTSEYSFLTGAKCAEFGRLTAKADPNANTRNISSFSSPLTQDTLQNRAGEGKNILPIAASVNSVDAVFEQMKAISPIGIEFQIDSESSLSYNELIKAYGANSVKQVIVDDKVFYNITNDKLSWNNSNGLIADGTFIGNNVGEHVNNAADNVKEGMPEFITSKNEPLILTLEQLQAPIDIYSEFFNTPTIINYFKRAQVNILNPTHSWSIDDEIAYNVENFVRKAATTKEVLDVTPKVAHSLIMNAYKDLQEYNHIYTDKVKNIIKAFNLTFSNNIDLKIKHSNNEYEALVNTLSLLESLNKLKRVQGLLSTYSKFLNVDKLSIAPDVNNYYDISWALHKIALNRENGIVLSSELTGTELIDGILQGGEYKSLASYYKYGQVLPYKIIQELFPHFNDSLQLQTTLLNDAMTGLSPKAKRALQNKARMYSIYRKYSKNNFISLSSGLSLYSILSDEIVPVNPYVHNVDFVYINYLMNNNTTVANNKDGFNKFQNLSDKLEYVQQLLHKHNINNAFISRLSPKIDTERFTSTIEFKNKDVTNDQVIVKAFSDLTVPLFGITLDDNLIINSLMSDLVRYSFYTSGFNFQHGGFSQYIPKIVIQKLNLVETLNQEVSDEINEFSVYDLQRPTYRETYNNLKSVYSFMLEVKNKSIVPQAPIDISINDELETIFTRDAKIVKIPSYKMRQLEDRVKEAPIVYTREFIENDGIYTEKLRYFIKLGVWQGKQDKSKSYWYQEVSHKGSVNHYGFNTDNSSRLTMNDLYLNAVSNGFPEKTDYIVQVRINKPSAFPTPLLKNWLLIDTDDYTTEDTNLDYEDQRTTEESNVTLDVILDNFDKLQQRFKYLGLAITLEINGDLKVAARVLSNGVIQVNPRLMRADSIHHEFGHIILDLIEDDNFINMGLEQAKLSPIYNKIKELYPEYDEPRLLKEVLVTEIGTMSSQIEQQPKLVSWFKYFIRKLADKLYKLTNGKIGKNLSVVERIAYGLVNTNALPLINLKLIIKQNDQRIDSEMSHLKQFNKSLYGHFVNIDSAIDKTIRFYNLHKNDIIGENEIEFLRKLKSELSLDYMLGKLGLVQQGTGVTNNPMATLSPFEIEFAKYSKNIGSKITNIKRYETVYRVYGKEVTQSEYDIAKAKDDIIEAEGKLKNPNFTFTRTASTIQQPRDYSVSGESVTFETVEMSRVMEVFENLLKFSNEFLLFQYGELDSLNNMVRTVYLQYLEFANGNTTENIFDSIPQVTINNWATKITAIKEIFELYKLLSFDDLKDLDLDSPPVEVPISEITKAFANKDTNPDEFAKIMMDHQEFLNYKLYRLVQGFDKVLNSNINGTSDINDNVKGAIQKSITFTQKVITMWATNRTGSSKFKQHLDKLTDNNYAPNDATWFQLHLMPAHMSHDALLANTAKLLNSIDISISINSKAELEQYEALEVEMFKALKAYNAQHGTNYTDDIFYDNSKLLESHDLRAFWEDYKNRPTKPIRIGSSIVRVPINFEEFVTSKTGGVYDLKGARAAYNAKVIEYKNNVISKEDFDNWEEKHITILKNKVTGANTVYPKVGGAYVIIGDIYEKESYKQFKAMSIAYPVFQDMFNLISKFQIEYTQELESNVQGRGLSVAIRKKRNIKNVLMERLIQNKRSTKLDKAIRLNLIDDKPSQKSLSFKYLGLLDKKPEYFLPKRYVHETLEAYKERALNSVNRSYVKQFKTFDDIVAENKQIANSNLEYHIANAQTKPSKFMRQFIQEIYTIRAQRQHELVLLMIREHIANTKYKKGKSLGNIKYSISNIFDVFKSKIKSDVVLAKQPVVKSNILKQLDSLLDRHLYREDLKRTFGDSAINKFLIRNVTNRIGFLTSLAYMGYKWTLAQKDFLSGRLKMVMHAAEGVHFNFTDLMYNSWFKTPISYGNKVGNNVNSIVFKMIGKNILPENIRNNNKDKDYILSVFTNYVNYMAHLNDKNILTSSTELALSVPFMGQAISSHVQETMLVTIMTNVNHFIGDQLYSKREYVNFQIEGVTKFNISEYKDKALTLLNSIDKSKLNDSQIKQFNKLHNDINVNNTDLRKNIMKVFEFFYDTTKVKLVDKIEIRDDRLRYKIPESTLNMNFTDYMDEMQGFNDIEKVFYRIEKVINEILNTGVEFEDLFKQVHAVKTIKSFVSDLLQDELKLLSIQQGLENKSDYERLLYVISYNSITKKIEPSFALASDNKLLNIATDFKAKVTQISHKNQGVYNTEHKPAINNTVLGNQFMKMFQWFPPLYDQVIGARLDYSKTYNFDGDYTSAYNEMGQRERTPSMTYINGKFVVKPVLEMTYFMTAKLFYNMINGLRKNKKSVEYLEISLRDKILTTVDEYRWMDENTKAAVRGVLMRDVILLALILLTRGLANLLQPDDDDDELDNKFATLYYLARSVGMEFTSLFALGIAYGGIGKYQSPMVALGYIYDISNVIGMQLAGPTALSARDQAIWGPDYTTNVDKALVKINPLNKFNPLHFNDVNKAQYRKITGDYPSMRNMKAKMDVDLDSRIAPKPVYDLLFGDVNNKTDKDLEKDEIKKEKGLDKAKTRSEWLKKQKGYKY